MTRSIRDYCNANPIPKGKHQQKTATGRAPMSTGWAWSPDPETEAALKRGTRKAKAFKNRQNDLLKKEDTTMATSKKATSTKKPARRVTKKTASKKAPAKKGTSKKAPAKKTGSTKLIPLKKILPDGMDAKIARRKLRAADVSMGHEAQGRWEFTEAAAKKAKAVLSA